MPLQKQSIPINFSQGLDTKTDPFQVQVGKFLQLENTIFDKGGLLQKRNGYELLTALPNNNSKYVTTFKNNLLALGDNLFAFSKSSNTWVNKAVLKNVQLSAATLVRSNTNQTQADTAIKADGLMCTVYTDSAASTTYKYVIADSITGQNIVAPTTIIPSSGTVEGSPKVFLLKSYFIIVFTNNISGVYHLKYISIPVNNPTSPSTDVNITSQYTPATTVNFDGKVSNDVLYLAWNGSDLGGAIRVSSLDASLSLRAPTVFNGRVATIMSVTADETGNTSVIYVSFYDSVSQTGYTAVLNNVLTILHAPVQTIASEAVVNITSAAQNSNCEILYEVNNSYGYDGAIRTDFIKKRSMSQSGTLSSASVVIRSVGLASKAFIVAGKIYVLSTYSSAFQPSYFLISDTGKVIATLAYSNGGGYLTTGLPSALVNNSIVSIPYIIAFQIQAVNKTQGAANAAGVYSQKGVNLAVFDLDPSINPSVEIGNTLNFPGGFLMNYDGYSAVENGFFLWPDSVEATTSGSGGSISAQQYYYIATYEWADNQGNIVRSAPSVPVGIVTTGTTSSNTINVPTLRLTYKTANPVKIVLYRWSAAQQTYYQITSITSPLLNDTTIDSVSFVDTHTDASILGNSILYTTGGVIENIGPPAAKVVTLFNDRLFLIDAENPDLLWFSKQVIQATPVEMSDLLTIFVAPSIGTTGNTGSLAAMAPMDDKLILFKDNAIYYLNGTGPDNTGANSQYSEPVFITSTIGCSNQNSIVFMPNGLMFQSDKGIWILGRDLQTNYIGASVQVYTQNATVLSAVNIPGTNQVRFIMDSGMTLMYDYYYGQWGTFTNIPAVSSTLESSLHTYVNSRGEVFQETLGKYLDNSNPVIMSFKTSWLNLAGLQGYERAYFFYILATYLSPHKLQVQISYDYNDSPTQSIVITPDNFATAWGLDPLWGSTPTWGGKSNIEQWRVFLKQQKCESFQIYIKEIYDSSLGSPAGAGLTISGLNLLVGLKSNSPRLKPSRSAG